ncbi:Gnk2-homologous domain-containing protein [Dioscorea alata]|uniref:Gnk2-homologous domain-containing protein n=1 Tax=Dioscorea alata TaxID=55571 RepID=A0ACB7WS58_DIOAL|nr:Gnk2-homologous domain-containing protein [Dioscorea alata]
MGFKLETLETLLLFLTALGFLSSISIAADLYSLIYKGCANGSLGGGAATQQAIASISSSLITQSSSSKFYKTSTSSSGQSLSGLYQCRGDLSGSDCAACINRVIPMWSSLCGPMAAAARVQLTGCYALYQAAGFPQVAGTQLLFKTCGSSGGGNGFEERRDTAFSNLQNGLSGSGGAGFYATSYQSVYAMAQCEGDLSAGDCGECVAEAVQKAEVECGGAASGQVYLDKCYISYNYYADGVPRGGGGGGGGQQTGKTVAIVVGGAAGLGFVVICLLFARSLRKGKDDY